MGLVSGIAATSVGPAMMQTAEDWSQSADKMQLAQMQLEGHKAYANALFSSKETAAQINQQTALEKTQMIQDFQAKLAEAKRGQFDPVQALSLGAGMSVPEAQARIQANQQGQPYQPSGPDGKILTGPDGQPVAPSPALTPQMRQILLNTQRGNAYGGNMQQQGEGAEKFNAADASSTITPTAGASTDPYQVGLVRRAQQGQPMTGALGGGNGTYNMMGQSQGGDLNDLGEANAEAAPLKAQAALDKADKGAKDNDFIHANAVLQASEKRLQELDTSAAKIRSGAVTPAAMKQAQAQLDSIAQERQQVQQQYEQARTLILPGARGGNNAIGRFWKQ